MDLDDVILWGFSQNESHNTEQTNDGGQCLHYLGAIQWRLVFSLCWRGCKGRKWLIFNHFDSSGPSPATGNNLWAISSNSWNVWLKSPKFSLSVNLNHTQENFLQYFDVPRTGLPRLWGKSTMSSLGAQHHRELQWVQNQKQSREQSHSVGSKSAFVTVFPLETLSFRFFFCATLFLFNSSKKIQNTHKQKKSKR